MMMATTKETPARKIATVTTKKHVENVARNQMEAVKKAVKKSHVKEGNVPEHP
tara:strand:+ start:195 stop:353 length:159 start_codon:yes stop_codon:yes gene_type:complete